MIAGNGDIEIGVDNVEFADYEITLRMSGWQISDEDEQVGTIVHEDDGLLYFKPETEMEFSTRYLSAIVETMKKIEKGFAEKE